MRRYFRRPAALAKRNFGPSSLLRSAAVPAAGSGSVPLPVPIPSILSTPSMPVFAIFDPLSSILVSRPPTPPGVLSRHTVTFIDYQALAKARPVTFAVTNRHMTRHKHGPAGIFEEDQLAAAHPDPAQTQCHHLAKTRKRKTLSRGRGQGEGEHAPFPPET